MGQSPFLPSVERLVELLGRLGLPGKKSPPEAPAAAESRIRFAAPRQPAEPRAAPAPRPPLAPSRVPADRALPTLAEMTDETLAVEVFGANGATPLDQRLARVLEWLLGSTGAFAAFVADSEGLTVANRHAPESYVAATGPLGRVQQSISAFVPSPTEGSTTLELDDQNVLQVIWAETNEGRMAVGLILSAPLDRSIVSRIRRVVHMAVTTKGMH